MGGGKGKQEKQRESDERCNDLRKVGLELATMGKLGCLQRTTTHCYEFRTLGARKGTRSGGRKPGRELLGFEAWRRHVATPWSGQASLEFHRVVGAVVLGVGE